MSRLRPYLMYHEIERDGRPLCSDDPGYVRYVVHEDAFRSQLARLRDRNLRGVSVGAAAANHHDEHNIVITFDDGCGSDLLIAAPLLAAEGFSATFYITTGFLGRPGFLTQPQVRELSDLGFDVGCHAATHRYLTDLPTNELDSEIRGAKQALESMIGRAVEHFSCPGGRWDARVERVVHEAGFQSMATSDIGLSDSCDRRLNRLAVMRATTMDGFDALCSGRGLFVPKLKTGVLRAAKRVLGNARYERLRSRVLKSSTTSP